MQGRLLIQRNKCAILFAMHLVFLVMRVIVHVMKGVKVHVLEIVKKQTVPRRHVEIAVVRTDRNCSE